MSDTSGPVSTLRGSVSAPTDGAMCDDHPDRPSVRRMQGETDSFGAEYHECCQECVDEFKQAVIDDCHGMCDWCKSQSDTLIDHRDVDEGMCGRVYRVCSPCRRKESERFQEELEASGHYDDYYDED